MNKLKFNFIYATAYKMLELLLPLITSPLLSRRLGAEALGAYTYTYSIVSLFVMYAELGSYRYGMREIAKVQNELNARNRVYSDIFWTHAANALVALVLYLILAVSIGGKYKNLMLLQSLCIVSNMIDNSFLYVGMEDMKAITYRDSVVKFGTFILIILLIKSPSDLILYVLIMNICGIVCKVIALLYAKKYVHLIVPVLSNCINHFKHMLVLMIPVIAAGIYQSMDKIMIGSLYEKEDVGYYDCASKALISKSVITIFGTVLCPHITNLYAEGKNEEAERTFKKSFSLSMIMSYAFMFGISAVAKEFAPLFWGEDFAVCAPMMIGLSVSLPLWTIGESIRNQFLLPNGRDHEYMWSFLVGVVVNAAFNFALIPQYGAMGAICATIAAEFAMSAVQIYFVRKEVKIIKNLTQTFPYFIASLFMYICIRMFSNIWNGNRVIGMVLEGGLGILSFLLFALIYEITSKKYMLLDILRRKI